MCFEATKHEKKESNAYIHGLGGSVFSFESDVLSSIPLIGDYFFYSNSQ